MPVYTTGQIALNQFASIQFNYRSTFTPLVLNRISSILVQYTTINSIQLDSIRGSQSEVVPSESKQFDSIRVYTMSEIEPVRIDSNLCASANGL